MSFTTHVSIMDGIGMDDDSAWNRFFLEYAPLIRLHGKDCGMPEDSLDDLVQNVMISVFSGNKNFHYDPEKGRFRDYLRLIIRARSADILREKYRNQNKKLPLDEEDCCMQLDELFTEEWREHVKKHALEKLKQEANPKHFQIFHMLDIQERDVKEVAKFFSIPAASVYSIRKRMEERLRQIADGIVL